MTKRTLRPCGSAGGFRTPSRSAGGALIEFAATLPLFLAVLLAVVDFSNYLNDRTIITAAAYNGAKAGAKPPCGNAGAARTAVRETVDGMLSVPGSWDLENPRTSGAAPVLRYVVTVRFDRNPSLLSPFTAHLPAFRTLRMTGVAVCERG